MSVFKKFCTGLFASLLSLTAQGAQPTQPAEPTQPGGEPEVGTPDQVPPSQHEVDVSDTREVIQVLYVSNASEIRIADLVSERNPDEGLRRYADELARDHAWMNKMIETLADVKSISLEDGQLEESAQLVGSMMAQEAQNLAQKPEEEFRSAFLESMIMSHQKTLAFYSQIEAGNSDDALKATIAISRQLVEKHLADAQRLQAGGTQPQQPTPDLPID
jgi:predicted outer membrane protein